MKGTDPDRTERLVRIYNDTYNNLRPRAVGASPRSTPLHRLFNPGRPARLFAGDAVPLAVEGVVAAPGAEHHLRMIGETRMSYSTAHRLLQRYFGQLPGALQEVEGKDGVIKKKYAYTPQLDTSNDGHSAAGGWGRHPQSAGVTRPSPRHHNADLRQTEKTDLGRSLASCANLTRHSWPYTGSFCCQRFAAAWFSMGEGLLETRVGVADEWH
jgi:hypothetical protein